MLVAAALFAFIYFFHRPKPPAVAGPARVLPGLNASTVTNLLVRPGNQPQIQAVRTNGLWRLTEPDYPAQSNSIAGLLSTLEHLTRAAYIEGHELKDRTKADEEFGLATPQATISFEQPGYHALLQIGAKTAPGDQVYLRVVGDEGIYVVDAELLKALPRNANDWRDPALVDLNSFTFDRVSVTNGTRVFELARDATNRLWRMVYPFYPVSARANNNKVHESLEMLHSLRARQFLPDDPKPDLESLGLQPPELTVAINQGTNTVALLQFGKSPTNDAHLVHARRVGQNAVVTVATELLAPWREKINDFRDPHLMTLSEPVGAVEVKTPEESFTLQLSNGVWLASPPNVAVDTEAANEFISNLGRMQIVEFVNDTAIEADLPTYGLATPTRRYILRSTAASSPTATNNLIAEVDFGTNQAEKVFAKRPDESFVYAVKAIDLQTLPTASWQLRSRTIFNFSTNDVATLTIRQDDRVRTIIRNGPFSWSIATNSQGIINDLAVEETVGELGQLKAGGWVARGEQNRARYGFTDNGHRIGIELKSGEKLSLEIGGEAPSGFRYAAVPSEGTLLIFEFPPGLYEFVSRYLTVPPGPSK